MPKENSIKLLINDIKKCNDNACYLAGLIAALTIPDICGKILFPDLKPKDRYIKWFNKYIGDYEQSPLCKEDPKWTELPYMSGEVCYKLRCALLHAGTDDIGKQINVNDFTLMFGKSCRLGSSGVEEQFDCCIDGTEVSKGKRIYWEVNVDDLCNKIIWSAEAFLKKEIKDESQVPTIRLADIPAIFRR